MSGLDERDAMPVEVCARQIIDAMIGRRRELVMTGLGKLGLWSRLIHRSRSIAWRAPLMNR